VKRLLHIGCGKQPLPEWLPATLFSEVRVDIEPSVEPDFVRNMLDLHDIGTFDFIYSSHNLEHLYPYEVPRALAEFMRVLNDGGAIAIVVPDLEDVRPTEEPLSNCELGLICGLDMYYGHHSQIEQFPYMAHHSGFIKQTLEKALLAAGFVNIKIDRLSNYNLCAMGEKIGPAA
jgi:SAM-dependent methyltransferase